MRKKTPSWSDGCKTVSYTHLDVYKRQIYSLGVLLYELLTGYAPFDPAEMKRLSLEEVLRIIREQEPPRPSDRLTRLDAGQLSETARQHLSLIHI